MKYSVFTVMMGSEYNTVSVLERLKSLGYNGVEWRVSEDFHVSPKDLVAQSRELIRLTQEYGMEMPSLATYLSAADISPLTEIFTAASMMGVGVVRVGIPRYDRTKPYHELFHEAIENLRKVEALAAEHHVKAVIEIHFGTIIPSPSMARRLVERFDPQHIGVIFDPGNMAVEGYENWKMGLEVLGEYLAHVHVKNAAWFPKEEGGWEWKWYPMRTGVVDWSQVMSDLKAIGYDGWMSLEDFCSLPVDEKLADDIAFLRELEAQYK
jgi:sugar phosphate isomerase/epimerase